MKQDKILEMFFSLDRWTYAIGKGIGKDIRRDQLYQLAKPEVRAEIYQRMAAGTYKISPPHAALIPKDTPGEFRTVYVNEPVDRIVLSIANDLLFELMPEMIHPACKSYQKGIGCGRIVQEVSRTICSMKGEFVGWKADLSKYFDSVPLRYIDGVFDRVEEKYGKSALISVIRDYYHSNIYFDVEGKLTESFQSLKQGCAVAAFLADAILFHIDEKLAGMNGYYVRYSDDQLFVGPDCKKAMDILIEELGKMEMKLNPKKVESLSRTHWFKFLGYSIKGADISLSKTRLKTFQKEIQARTTKKRDTTLERAVNAVNRYLYKGDGEHSWATQILPVVNVQHDIDMLNLFVMDCLRAVQTKKRRVGGLGYVKDQKIGCVTRGIGRNVTANRQKTEKQIEGYLTIGCMQKAMKTRRAVYNTLVMQL